MPQCLLCPTNADTGHPTYLQEGIYKLPATELGITEWENSMHLADVDALEMRRAGAICYLHWPPSVYNVFDGAHPLPSVRHEPNPNWPGNIQRPRLIRYQRRATNPLRDFTLYSKKDHLIPSEPGYRYFTVSSAYPNVTVPIGTALLAFNGHYISPTDGFKAVCDIITKFSNSDFNTVLVMCELAKANYNKVKKLLRKERGPVLGNVQ